MNEPSVITPSTHPPNFESYEAFRAHINALVERREREVREGRLSIAGPK